MAKKLLIHDYLSLDLDLDLDVQHSGQSPSVSKVVEGDLTKIFHFAEKYLEKGLLVKNTQRLEAKPMTLGEIDQGEGKPIAFDNGTKYFSVHKEQTESEGGEKSNTEYTKKLIRFMDMQELPHIYSATCKSIDKQKSFKINIEYNFNPTKLSDWKDSPSAILSIKKHIDRLRELIDSFISNDINNNDHLLTLTSYCFHNHCMWDKFKKYPHKDDAPLEPVPIQVAVEEELLRGLLFNEGFKLKDVKKCTVCGDYYQAQKGSIFCSNKCRKAKERK